VSPFAEPGLTDLSADVDFKAIAEAACRASDGVEVHGPVEQAFFLTALGIRERVEALKRAVGGTTTTTTTGEGGKEGGEEDAEQRRKSIELACDRLVNRMPGGMGTVYKVLAIIPEKGGERRPVGFGGDVVN
jgi:SAM-dependent MidA family methyltransferase